jgi:hypothetical protein
LARWRSRAIPECHAHDPCAKALTIPELTEGTIRLGEDFLRDVLGIFSIPQNAVRDPEDETGGIEKASLELHLQRFQRFVDRHGHAER